ncbi:MAG TPA: polymer-forming cytoskeletal protein [Burkholderiaceae bacterium]|nr:polymer-forming cytoskeletal protein [Burkholderiaceae bacterium]
MALQTSYFGKRDKEPEAFNLRQGHPSSAPAINPAPPNQIQPAQPSSADSAATTPAKENESKLTVGPNIKLKGVEITDCDTLVVEGTVEATMDSRVIQISERGAFSGSAEIDIAEIRGKFDGNLTVRQKLVIYSTGKVTGKVRYGKVVIEEGGQLSGEIVFGTAPPKGATLGKPETLHTA